jgi:hypothetical protein
MRARRRRPRVDDEEDVDNGVDADDDPMTAVRAVEAMLTMTRRMTTTTNSRKAMS